MVTLEDRRGLAPRELLFKCYDDFRHDEYKDDTEQGGDGEGLGHCDPLA